MSTKPNASANPVTPSETPSGVGPATSSLASQLAPLLAEVDALLGPVDALHGAQIRRMAKLRKGGEKVVTDLTALCSHHGITGVGPASVAEMSAAFERANELRQVGVQLAALQKRFSDATFTAESETWGQATALYSILQRLTLMDPDIAIGLAPVQEFFQTKRTKGKKRANAKAKALEDARALVAEASASPVTTAGASKENDGTPA